MKKPWMNSELKLLKDLWHTRLDDDAAALIGRSKQSCKAVAKRLKLHDPAFAATLAEREDAYRETVRDHQSEIKIALDREMLSIRCKP
jgi:hypothetical protein